MKLTLLTLGLLFALTGVGAFAAEDSTEVPSQGQTTAHEETADSSAGHIHWDFITCTHDAYECRREAGYHGYSHYRAVHDDHTCGGHEHYACYGGHH